MPKYSVRLVGANARGARIQGSLLRDLLDVLVEGARRAVRLRVDGRSSAPGSLPSWLDRAAGFEVVGLQAGSTIVELEAPTLGSVIGERLAQGSLFEEVEVTASGIELLRDSLRDALSGYRESDRYDAGLLDVMGGWKQVFEHGITAVELSNGAGAVTRIDQTGLDQVAELKRETPPPRRVRVSGWLETIRHSDRAFTLKLEDGGLVRGIAAEVPVEQLRTLFGRRATVSALAHFRPSGKTLRLEAEHIEAAGEDFGLWSHEPQPLFATGDATSLRAPQGPRSGVSAIMGQWPGEETDEEISAFLRDLS